MSKIKKSFSFTVIELLVVISIIAILLAISLPAIIRARKHSQSLKCQTNLDTLYKAFVSFSHDNNDFFPGTYYTRNESEVWKTDWLSGQGPLPFPGINPSPANLQAAFDSTPQNGTLFKYYGKQPLILRCPIIKATGYNMGKGSNGKFDYSMIGPFSGAKTDRIEADARFKNPATNVYERHPTPLILEEDPDNYINKNWIEGCHGHTDKFSVMHNGGSYYAAVDGRISFLSPPAKATFWDWEFMTPSGIWWSQHSDFLKQKFNLVWGEWNRR